MKIGGNIVAFAIQEVPSRSTLTASTTCNVIAGVWLAVSPFLLGYGSGDAYWSPILFGTLVALFAVMRSAEARRVTGLSWANAAIGLWVFLSGFWLAASDAAKLNSWIVGLVILMLGLTSASRKPGVGSEPPEPVAIDEEG